MINDKAWPARRLFVRWLLPVFLVLAAWFGWRWYTTPLPPELPLERMEKAVAEAVDKALQEVRRRPRSGEAWGQLAMVAAVNGFHEQALVCLAEAERFDPDNPRWPYLRGHTLMSENPPEAFRLLERALERAESSEQRAAIHFRLALPLIEHGRLDEAEHHLDRLREIEAGSVRVHFGLGLLALARDDRPSAREHLKALVGSPFGRKRAHGYLATLALADGDKDLGRIYQQRAAQLPADVFWPDPFLEELKPYAVSLENQFEEAERLERQGRPREAVALLRRVAAEVPNARSYLNLGLALTRLNQFDEAEKVLRLSIELGARQMSAHHFLASLLFIKAEKLSGESGGNDKALDLFQQVVAEEEKALTLKGNDAFVHMTRGRALAYLGRTSAALAALRKAVLYRPDLAETHLYLGVALAESGELTEGLIHLEDAVRLALPENPGPRAALEKWRAKAKTSP